MTPRIALDNFYVISTCLVASLLAIFVCTDLYHKANKSTLLYEYLSTQLLLIIWTLSKIFKTVAPTLSIRWFFVVVQYFSISFIGVAFLNFAYHYATSKVITTKGRCLLAVPALFSFALVLTNPWHHLFYATFDMYRDTFGPLFYFHQAIVYIYLIIGIFLCSKDFTKQTHLSKVKAAILASAVLFPLLVNVLYVFKVLKLLFHIRLPMDITPIACMLSYLLFYLATLRYRFLDVTPLAYQNALQHSIDGLGLYDDQHNLYWSNPNFHHYQQLISTDGPDGFDINETKFDLPNSNSNNNNNNAPHTLLRLSDRRPLRDTLNAITARENALKEAHRLLQIQSDNMAELTHIRVKNDLARHVHDVLGHGMVLVITLLEVAAMKIKSGLPFDQPYLNNAVTILHDNFNTIKTASWSAASITPENLPLSAMLQNLEYRLKPTGVHLEIIEQGSIPNFTISEKSILFDICREAVTNAIRHGKATAIHIFLRTSADQFILYIIDDGVGCQNILPGMGLNSIQKRAASLNAALSYSTESESGFSIHLSCPLNQLVL